MAIPTNKPVRVMRILEGLGLAKYFRVVYGGNSFETKPDPLAPIRFARIRCLSNEAIVIGDSRDANRAQRGDAGAAKLRWRPRPRRVSGGTYFRPPHRSAPLLGSVAKRKTFALAAHVIAQPWQTQRVLMDSSLNWMRQAACSARAAIWRQMANLRPAGEQRRLIS
jgi:hypothetical protein